MNKVAHGMMFLLVFNCWCGFLFNMPDYPDPARFSWSLYLEETGSKAVPAEAFKVVRIINVLFLIQFTVWNDNTSSVALSVLWLGRKQQWWMVQTCWRLEAEEAIMRWVVCYSLSHIGNIHFIKDSHHIQALYYLPVYLCKPITIVFICGLFILNLTICLLLFFGGATT